jgi:diaminopimelate epimerase
VRVLNGGLVEADLGAPAFAPSAVPVRWQGPDALRVPVEAHGVTYELACVLVGTAHAVAFVDDVDDVAVADVGRAIERAPIFPEGTNVDFVTIASHDTMRMRVWERGVGETRACGTGACAAAVAGQLLHGTAESVTVHLPGGELDVRWDGLRDRAASVLMVGATTPVFRGEVSV